jgi:hypothetical protein
VANSNASLKLRSKIKEPNYWGLELLKLGAKYYILGEEFTGDLFFAGMGNAR